MHQHKSHLWSSLLRALILAPLLLNFGLAFAEDLTEVADTYLAVAKKVQKPKPGLVREGTEELRCLGRGDIPCGS